MKNAILCGITLAMAWQFCFGICTLDSDIVLIPFIRMAGSGAWLFLFFKANGWFLKVGGR